MSLFEGFELESTDEVDGDVATGHPVESDVPVGDGAPEGEQGAAGSAASDSRTTPSAEEIAHARQVLAEADATSQTQQAPAAAPQAEPPTKEQLDAELQRANESAETAQLLSNIAAVRHQTAMGIIGNIR
jgi:hypothetical protein